ncbi:MAG: efflux transporter outer membrane subunit [Planctomycetaceae bacterium]|nr:efflux transporter outer membrane subunit [Planctomycetaceae bacterium]
MDARRASALVAGLDRRPSWRRLAAGSGLSLLMLAAGCMTSPKEYIQNGLKVGPNYRKPAAPIAEHWIDYADARVISQPQNNWAWWQTFNDPILSELIQTASQQNLTLRQAGFRVMEARALDAYARGNLFPQSQTGFGGYSRNLLSEQVGFVGGGGGGAGVPREFSVWTLGTQFQWELDFWGRFRRSIEAADAQLDATIEDYDDVLVILIADVASAYVDVRTLEQRLRYARQNVQNQSGSLRLAEDKKEAGVSSQLDVAQAVTNVAQTESTIPQFEADLRVAENRLCTLMGMPPQDIRALLAGNGGIRPIPTAAPEVVLGIPADLIRRRPDVRRQERLVAQQSALIGVAESDLYPAFSITGQIFVRASQFDNLFLSNATGGNVGPSFQWNIFNYGRIRNLVAAEEARFMQQVSLYQQTVLDANREAEDAIIRFLQSQEQVRILETGAAAAAESRDLVNELYQGGQADFGRVFVAELFLVQQQDALAVAQGTVARSLVEINRALGGGWQIRLQGPATLVELPPVEEVQAGPEVAEEAAGPEAPEAAEAAPAEGDDEEGNIPGLAPDPAFEPTPEITLPEEFDGQKDLPEVK